MERVRSLEAVLEKALASEYCVARIRTIERVRMSKSDRTSRETNNFKTPCVFLDGSALLLVISVLSEQAVRASLAATE